ncbi:MULTISPECIES: class I SAM-dependent methyltransferase [Cyanophyceae]|uniref:class I SAM-dependent methyltransferase n=1 Tax=Cyanophyceae TaxID=3028117 RepID=UPI0016820CD1|nr:class I SAM-dependent methyltransferase [Trichocoleus sp. FACHB-69]MBD1933045.1 methyltransferase domain-containing protein [Trichocoleus sp. FACHB-69]
MSNLLPRIEFLLQSLVKKQKTCPHCQLNSLSTIAKKYSVIKIKQCDNCGLCFTDPIYESMLVSNLYDRFYSGNGSTTSYPSYEELKILKSNGFASSDKYFGDRIKAIKYLKPGGKLLEIGSSWGYFSYQATQQDFEVTGVEISEPRRQFGAEYLGINIVKNIRELNGEVFDIVYTSHVLEHFTNLSTIFKDLYQVLKKDGIIIIEVPNFDYAQFGEQVLSLIGAIHPLGFSSKFFKKNLPKYGFQITGFYDSWDLFPEHKVEQSSQNVIILTAKKSG